MNLCGCPPKKIRFHISWWEGAPLLDHVFRFLEVLFFVGFCYLGRPQLSGQAPQKSRWLRLRRSCPWPTAPGPRRCWSCAGPGATGDSGSWRSPRRPLGGQNQWDPILGYHLSLVLVGIYHFWRGTPPHIHKQGFINPGSTLPGVSF